MAGIILYLLDSLIFVLAGDWLSVGFHAFALFMINGGYRQLKRAKEMIAAESGIKQEAKA